MRRTRRMRTKRKRTGTRLGLIIFSVGLSLGLPFALAAIAGDQKGAEPAAIVGTVFRDPGFAFPGVEVTLTAKTPPEGMKAPKPRKTTTDGRGEFAFRVPAAKAEYVVTAQAPGYQRAESAAALAGGPDRVEIYITLKPNAQQGN
jgi:hypothetical protein